MAAAVTVASCSLVSSPFYKTLTQVTSELTGAKQVTAGPISELQSVIATQHPIARIKREERKLKRQQGEIRNKRNRGKATGAHLSCLRIRAHFCLEPEAESSGTSSSRLGKGRVRSQRLSMEILAARGIGIEL